MRIEICGLPISNLGTAHDERISHGLLAACWRADGEAREVAICSAQAFQITQSVVLTLLTDEACHGSRDVKAGRIRSPASSSSAQIMVDCGSSPCGALPLQAGP